MQYYLALSPDDDLLWIETCKNVQYYDVNI